jgi:spore coat polysaccharide biosynthesis protein SpsF
MGSSRLPGKVLMMIGGRTMLDRVVRRVSRADRVHDVVVATTDRPQDDMIGRAATGLGVAVYRGSEDDVLGRFRNAALVSSADTVVRVTADCPLVDAEVVDAVISAFESASPPADLATNAARRTFPHGLDVEVLSAAILNRLDVEVPAGYHRSHVTSYLYEPDHGFRIRSVEHAHDLSHFRWTVDTAEDLALVRGIYEQFDNEDGFSWHEVAACLAESPELMNLNSHIRQRPVHEG